MSNPKPKRIEQLGNSVEELFSYAEAMERAAVRRYRALSEMMTMHNNLELADLFARFVDIEQKHVDSVSDYSRELGVAQGTVAPYPGAGLDGEEVMDFEELHYLHRPYHAIALAHRYEEHSAQLYANIARTTKRDDVRKVAEHLAADEVAHMKELERWLARYPRPEEGWDDDLDPPVEAE